MQVTIVTPVYNDWDSLSRLMREVENLGGEHKFSFLVIDDASPIFPQNFPQEALSTSLTAICLRLNTNLGHQRAIAIGLAYLQSRDDPTDAVVVMDSDGEDRVSDLRPMLDLYEQRAGKVIVFAKRIKRSENLRFKIGYWLYKRLFHALTGRQISFGNFSCVPPAFVEKIAFHPDAWNHYSGCVLKAGLPYDTLPTHRGSRYAGESKMNTRGLILHGLSSIALYMEEASIRLIGLSFAGMLTGGLALLVTVGIRLFSDLAVPGWATYVSLMLMNVISMMFVVSVLGLMLRLSGRNTMQLPPAHLYRNYILREYDLNKGAS